MVFSNLVKLSKLIGDFWISFEIIFKVKWLVIDEIICVGNFSGKNLNYIEKFKDKWIFMVFWIKVLGINLKLMEICKS